MGVLLSKMNTQEGKIDFHSLQTSCVTLAVESGANAKEAQVLARRSAPQFTMSVYAYARNKRLAEVTEMMGEKVLAGQMCVTGVSQACQTPCRTSPPQNTNSHQQITYQRPSSMETGGIESEF